MRGGPEFRDWDVKTYMLASAVDAIREGTYALAVYNTDPKKKRPERPHPIYRPENVIDRQGKKKQNQFAAMARAALSAARNRKE